MMTRRSIVIAGTTLAADPCLAATSDWATAPPESAGLRADAVADALQAGEALPGLRALLVARHGTLVAERYYGGSHAEGLQAINSATKSVCSMLVGLALRDGRIKSLDETVARLIPEAVAEVPASPMAPISLRQLLAGRSGLAFDPMQYGRLARAKPLMRWALARPAEPVPTPGWSYNDALVALISPIVERAQGADLAALAQRQLFEPLGINRFEWRRDRDGHPVAPAGLALRPRDLLKLAALMADGGRWQGTQVLPEPGSTRAWRHKARRHGESGKSPRSATACSGSPGACTATASPGPGVMAASSRCWRPS